MKTQIIQARVEPKLKRDAERIFSEIGLSTTDAFRVFLKSTILHQGIPFSVSIPNKETLKAFNEDTKTLSSYKDVDKMHSDILSGKI